MERAGIIVMGASMVVAIISVAALLVYSRKIMYDLPTEGIYRLSFEWLTAWNMVAMGVFFGVFGSSLVFYSLTAEGSSHRLAVLGLAGGIIALVGQVVDLTLGNPLLTSYLPGIDDDLFSALSQSASLAGTSLFIVCGLLWWRGAGRSSPRQ